MDAETQSVLAAQRILREQETDPDISTFPERVQREWTSAREEILKSMRDQDARAQFSIEGDRIFQRLMIEANDIQFNREIQAFEASSEDALNVLENEYATVDSEDERSRIVAKMVGIYTSQERAGFNPAAVQRNREQRLGQLVRADVARDREEDPAGTLDRLEDAGSYPGLTALEREQEKAQTRAFMRSEVEWLWREEDRAEKNHKANVSRRSEEVFDLIAERKYGFDVLERDRRWMPKEVQEAAEKAISKPPWAGDPNVYINLMNRIDMSDPSVTNDLLVHEFMQENLSLDQRKELVAKLQQTGGLGFAASDGLASVVQWLGPSIQNDFSWLDDKSNPYRLNEGRESYQRNLDSGMTPHEARNEVLRRLLPEKTRGEEALLRFERSLIPAATMQGLTDLLNAGRITDESYYDAVERLEDIEKRLQKAKSNPFMDAKPSGERR
jgi:hypothetical protein